LKDFPKTLANNAWSETIMTKNRNLIAAALKEIDELERIRHLLELISEECSKDKKDWSRERVILLVELYISRNNCHLEYLKFQLEELEAKTVKKARENGITSIQQQKGVKAA
jgi:hypothetical protein